MVYDDDSRPIGQGTKQAAASPLEITDTSLPYDLIVYPSATDADPLSFWYSDQFWYSNSTANQCDFKDNYNKGERQGDCGFNYSLPGIATMSATKDHPLPTPAAFAIAGGTTFLNKWASTPPTTGAGTVTGTPASSTAASTPTYVTGQCGVHITQYQKNENETNPSDSYELDVTLYSGNKTQGALPLFNSGQLPFPDGKNISIKGLVSPFTIVVPEGCFDTWGINMAFAGQWWVTNSTQCNAKDYYDMGEGISIVGLHADR